MKDNHFGVLLEDIQSKLEGIAEDVTGLHSKIDQVNTRLIKVEESANLIAAIKAAVTDQTHQLTDHEVRVAKLETA